MLTTIRAATLEDVNVLVRLNAVVQGLHHEHRPDQFCIPAPATIADWFREQLAKNDCHVWLAEQNDVAIGYVFTLEHVRQGTPFTLPRRWLEIDQIAVVPECRQQGVASTLLSHVVDFARTSDHHAVELTTWAFNEPAHRLFRKFGLTPKYQRLERLVHQ
jgi:GNAT superfamily N-acetyltransferase